MQLELDIALSNLKKRIRLSSSLPPPYHHYCCSKMQSRISSRRRIRRKKSGSNSFLYPPQPIRELGLPLSEKECFQLIFENESHIKRGRNTDMINGNSTESECFPYWWCAYAHPGSERSDCRTGFDPRITIVGQLHQDRPKPASSLAPSKLFNFSF